MATPSLKTFTNKRLWNKSLWQLLGLSFAAILIIYLVTALFRATPGTQEAQVYQLQSEIRKLRSYSQQLQQEKTTLREQIIDLETVNQIQQQVINELRTGNEALQQELHQVEKDIQRYKQALQK